MIITLRPALLSMLCVSFLVAHAAPLLPNALQRRAFVPIHIYTDSRQPEDDYIKDEGDCRAHARDIQAAFQEVLILATAGYQAASTAIGHPDSHFRGSVNHRDTIPFHQFFGPDAVPEIIAARYKAIIDQIDVSAVQIVDAIDLDRLDQMDPVRGAITIQCWITPETMTALADSQPDISQPGVHKEDANIIRLHAQLLQKEPKSYKEVVKAWLDSPGGPFSVEGLSITIFHELFHSWVLYPDGPLVDVKGSLSYELSDVQNLSVEEKNKNAHNYVWYAFMWLAKPQLFEKTCTAPSSITHLSKRKQAVVGNQGLGQTTPVGNGSQRPSADQRLAGSTLPPAANGVVNGGPSAPVSGSRKPPVGTVPGSVKPAPEQRQDFCERIV
ncbi:hypothetical protein HGRIS_000650 [Hohenbuehelia grisea]|uniref:Lysine-specific metallo-endopeptidase domain-containing protein n=1 Tax=Hohenbuehelia grisea TaxID=104357 RepID=A0ABR3JT93_9AGAR